MRKGYRSADARLMFFENGLLYCKLTVASDIRKGLLHVSLGAVGSWSFAVLKQGLINLEASCEGERVVTFCIVQKVTKKHARTCKKLPVASFCASETAETGRIANRREQGDHVSRRRRSPATSIQIAGRYVISAETTSHHQVTGFAKSCNFTGYRRQ